MGYHRCSRLRGGEVNDSACRNRPAFRAQETPRKRTTFPLQWGEQDSNLRRHSQWVYSPSPLTTRTSPRATAILESADAAVRLLRECTFRHRVAREGKCSATVAYRQGSPCSRS